MTDKPKKKSDGIERVNPADHKILRHHNDLLQIVKGNLDVHEQKVFFAMCYAARQRGTKEVELTFLELRKHAGIQGSRHPERLAKYLAGVMRKIVACVWEYWQDVGTPEEAWYFDKIFTGVIKPYQQKII